MFSLTDGYYKFTLLTTASGNHLLLKYLWQNQCELMALLSFVGYKLNNSDKIRIYRNNPQL